MVVFALVILAGCAQSETADPIEDAALVATQDTGVLRGFVVNERVEPLVDEEVRVTQQGAAIHTLRTDAEGSFGIDGVVPGVYVVVVQPEGHFPAEAIVTVVANVAEPELVRLQPLPNAQEVAYALQHVWEGHMVCAATGGNYCALPRLYVGVDPFGDDSIRLFYDEFVDVGRIPTFVQAELVWDSTQTLTPTLHTRWTATNPEMWSVGQWNYTFGTANGESPVVFSIDEEMARESWLGRDMGLAVEMFATTPGLVLDQDFTIYITVFYGYTPPEGWRFVDDSQVPPA